METLNRATGVVVHVWGRTPAEQEHAIRMAHYGWGRCNWAFVETDRHDEQNCPLDLYDGRSLAADSGSGWAYIVYAASTP